MNRADVIVGSTVAVRREILCERSGEVGFVEYVQPDGVGLLFVSDYRDGKSATTGFYAGLWACRDFCDQFGAKGKNG